MERKMDNFWKCILPSILVMGLQFFVTGAVAFFLFAKKAHEFTQGSYNGFMKDLMDEVSSSGFNSIAMLSYAIVALIVFLPWYKKVFAPKGGEKWTFSKLTKKPVHFVGGVVLLAFGMQYVCVYLMNALAVLFAKWLAMYQMLMESSGLTEQITVPIVLYTVIVGPICEELAFRGLTMGYAKRFTSFWAANVIQALLFAGMHMNPLQGIYTFLMGLLFGYLVHKSGTVVTGIILHMAFNAVGVLANSLIIAGSNPMQMFFVMFGAMVATYVGVRLVGGSLGTDTNGPKVCP